ncbi:MAG: tetratricopeptide repeat protein [Deltaproteobacteria bacterium]|nr:tetratricopeptide repeat protein [Deltaproteobacteria bacterium]
MTNHHEDDHGSASGGGFDDSEAASLLEAATTLWRDLGDRSGARRYFDQLRELVPTHPDVIEYFKELAVEAARLLDERVDDEARRLAAWRRVLLLDHGDPEANAALKRHYESNGEWRALVNLSLRELDAIPAGERDARLTALSEILPLYRDRLDDAFGCLRVSRQILELAPGDVGAFETITTRLKDSGRWFDLAEVVTRRAACETEPTRKLELWWRSAALAVERTAQPTRAAEAFERVLELEPRDQDAVAGLKEAHRRRRSWGALLRLLEREAASLEGTEKWKALVEAAELAEGYAADPQRAREIWRAVLELKPGHPNALLALGRIAERLGDWEALVANLAARIDRASGEDARVELLVVLGRTLHSKLGDSTRAIEPLERVIASRPQRGDARRLLTEIYVSTSRWQALQDLYVHNDDAGVLVRLLDSVLRETDDPAKQQAIALRCAELLRVQIGHADRAVPYYEQVLEIDPRNRQAAQQLAPVYLQRRDWERLLSVIEAMPEETSLVDFLPKRSESLLSMERAALLGRKWGALVEVLKRRRDDPAYAEQWQELTQQIGVILEDKLSSKRQALEAYGELLEHNPGDPDYLLALAHHLDGDHRALAAQFVEPHSATAGDWPLHARALTTLAEVSQDPGQRVGLLRRLAQVQLDRLDDPLAAYGALSEALSASPAEPQIWDQLAHLAQSVGMLEDLSEKLGQAFWSGALESTARVQLAGRLVELLDDRLGLHDRAEVYHWQLLRAGGDNGSSFSALESLFREEQGRAGELLDLYELVIVDCDDRTRRLDLRRRACLAADELGDPKRAIEVYRALGEDAPGDGHAAERLEELYTDTGRFRDLYRLLEGRLESVMPYEAAEFRFKLADIAQHRLGRVDLAVEWYARLLEDDPQHTEALEAVEGLSRHPALGRRVARRIGSIFAKLGDAARVARMLERQLEDRESTVGERVQTSIDLASVRERALGDSQGAMNALFEGFAAQPDNRAIRAQLARLTPGQGASGRYAELLDSAVSSVVGDSNLEVELLIELARVEELELDRPERAEVALSRVIEEYPRTASLEDRTEIVLRLAQVAGQETAITDRVIGYLREIYDRDSSDLRVLTALERLYDRSGQWLELIDVLRRHSSIETDPEMKRSLLLKMSELASSVKSRRR